MTKFVLNAFSFNMVSEFPANVFADEITKTAASMMAEEAVSAVGHADTARVFSSVLGTEIPANRTTVSLGRGDVVLVGQYRGPRLQEGSTELPEGATIQWLRIEIL